MTYRQDSVRSIINSYQLAQDQTCCHDVTLIDRTEKLFADV